MPTYPGDELKEASRLTTEQIGALHLLKMDYWINGPLPNDDAVLARITRMAADAWSNSQAVLRSFFELGPDGKLHRAQLDLQLAKAEANQAAATDKAKKAAGARWGKDAPSMLQALLEAMPEQCPSPSPSPSKSQSTSEQKPLAQSAVALNAVVRIPLVGDSTYPVTEEQVAHWDTLYPAVDVLQELRKMVGWHDSHPRQRKTPRGIKASINTWLAKEQDKGGASNRQQNRAQQRTNGNLEALRIAEQREREEEEARETALSYWQTVQGKDRPRFEREAPKWAREKLLSTMAVGSRTQHPAEVRAC
jgi:uncharacterized protein YdaU (DUF1376 family)